MSTSQPLKRIGLVYALSVEAHPLIRQLGLKEVPGPDPRVDLPFFEGSFSGPNGSVELRLVQCGKDRRYGVDQIGTNAAVLATYLLCQPDRPDLILNPGTAGGFLSQGARIAEVVLGQGSVRFHDRRVPLGNYERAGWGDYPVLEAPSLRKSLRLRGGVISTGNSFDCPEIDRLALESNQAVAKEMEAAAVGWVAWTLGVPFLPIKSITDFVEHHEQAEEQFLRNYEQSCLELTRQVQAILAYCAGRSLSSL